RPLPCSANARPNWRSVLSATEIPGRICNCSHGTLLRLPPSAKRASRPRGLRHLRMQKCGTRQAAASNDFSIIGTSGRVRQTQETEDPMPDIRKIVTTREVVLAEMGAAPARPIVRAVGLAVIANPYAGRSAEDLTELFRAGLELGDRLMPQLVRLLEQPAVSYGKGALVGVNGEMEHGGACVHPML